jgi:signal-transduction protein with cAMP-binding, CBS, and nucleotidyltransferase domain
MRAPTTLVRDLCTHAAVTVQGDVNLTECARLMRENHVGSLVVLDESGRRAHAAGMLTDRDIVVGPVAAGLDPGTLKAGEVMTSPLATVRDDDDILDALARMREHGTRRLAVLDARKQLVGVVAMDDLLAAIAQQIDAFVNIVKAEQGKEAVTRVGGRAPYDTSSPASIDRTSMFD